MDRELLCSPPDGYHAGCYDCEAQYLPVDIQKSGELMYSGQFTDEEAKKHIKTLLDIIKAARTTLSQTLKTHGDLILNRWSKKSKEKRAALLTSTTLLGAAAAGNDGPDPLDRWIRSNGMTWNGARWMVLKPFAEDRMRLLSLLHLRTTYPPSAWGLVDTRESMASFGHPDPTVSQLYFNANCVKMFGEKEYGELVEWNDTMCHSWAYAGFPRAFFTITIQKDILAFLAEMAMQLVQDTAGTGDQKWAALVSNGFRASGGEALWGSYTTPAFAPPAFRGFDATAMLSKAQARLNVCLDDIWLMQTDPAFMLYIIRDRKASTIHSTDDAASVSARWEQLAWEFIQDIIARVSVWHIVTRAREQVKATLDSLGNEAKVGYPLPPEADRILGELGRELGLDCSRFKAYEAGGSIRHTELMRMDTMKSEDRLAYLIYRLQEGVSNGSIHLSVNFDMLELELLSQGPASLMDKRMLDQLSDITTLHELRQMWLWNQMGQGTFDVELAKKTPAEFHEHVVGGSLQRAARFEPRTIARIARLLRAFAETPWPKSKGRKDLAWLYAATESRNKLAAFWDALREELRQAQVAAGLNMERSALGTFDFDSEPEHLAYLEHERAECEEASRLAEANALAALQRLSVAHDDDAIWSASSESGPVRRKQTKAKASRARGSCEDEGANEATASSANDTTSSSEDEASSTKAPIFVKQDSISTFHKMFRSDSAEGGGVRWSQFVQAFEDAGFTPTTGGGGGSSVSFSSDVGTIVFHRPHPDPVIDPVMLHGMGRRMRRRFGWCRERFLVRPKDV
ncbi:hypothetical protein LTR56_019363 [Elasticomyces elasticus]|nr:hypothetical protein LTR56_019363 [Elasticomyces elasticus]KAK3658605.1 hypothetical protein LTR22_008777 [Elasticomyces elasticus]KAK4911377.1 hypothetical protein LTR49_020028 [Elasticomyces elasticus]KAK5747037.1 hypothetical protein LTS12_022503 [Elasticomyces elasticus]